MSCYFAILAFQSAKSIQNSYGLMIGIPFDLTAGQTYRGLFLDEHSWDEIFAWLNNIRKAQQRWLHNKRPSLRVEDKIFNVFDFAFVDILGLHRIVIALLFFE